MKPKSKASDERKPVYLRMDRELIDWLDKQALRQRRSRAFVVSQAVRMMRAIQEQMEQGAASE